MPKAIRLFVHAVEAMNRVVGLFAMYLIFAILGVLFYSSISKAFFLPRLDAGDGPVSRWSPTICSVAAYSMQTGAHVRMDLFYRRWSPRTKAAVDSITISVPDLLSW